MSKLVNLVGPPSTLAVELSPFITRSSAEGSPCACESSCQVLLLPPWQDVAAELLTPGLLNADLCSSP